MQLPVKVNACAMVTRPAGSCIACGAIAASLALVDAIVRRRRSWGRAVRNWRPRPRRASWRGQCGVRAKTWSWSRATRSWRRVSWQRRANWRGQRRRAARSWRPRPRRASWRRASWRGQLSWRPLSLTLCLRFLNRARC